MTIVKKVILGLIICWPFALLGQIDSLGNKPMLEIISVSEGPVIGRGFNGTEDIKYGIEGGRVVKINGIYHLITTERAGDPIVVKTRIGHWKSLNGNQWERVGTLFQSSGNYNGEDPRAALWGPMPIWDKKGNVWKLFYVAYRAKPSTSEAWFENYEGRIWQAISVKKGINGIGGPYRDVGIMLEPGPESHPWEGLQGVDSFFAYQVKDQWYAFYGSAQTQHKPCKFWGVGLAVAKSMDGPWKRVTGDAPVNFQANFAENPVVTQLDNGLYIAMVDGGGTAFGYSISKDGVNWSKARFIDLSAKAPKWWKTMRTPLCLIKEADGSYTVFFTCFPGERSDIKPDFGSMGRVNFKLNDIADK